MVKGLYMDKWDQDLYDKQGALYYFFQVMQVIYVLGILGHLVLVLNATVVHTHSYQNNNGPLYSERALSLYWYALVFSICRIFTFLASSSLILYRKTACCCRGSTKSGCSYFWVIILAMCVCLDIAVLAVLGSYFNQCNVPGNAGNPCNDLRYCHVPEVYNVMASGCTYETAWTPAVTLAQLTTNVDFRWLFATSVFFVAFDVVFLFVPLGFWIDTNLPCTNEQEEEEDDDDASCAEIEYDVFDPVSSQFNNLRKRK